MMTLKVNGREHQVDADPDTPLLYVLREDIKLNAAKFGCGLGQCGACTVIVDGKAVLSCVTPMICWKASRSRRSKVSARVENPRRSSAPSWKSRRRNAAIASPA